MTSDPKTVAELRHLNGLREQLGDIEHSLRMRKAGDLGPRRVRALLAATAVFGAACVATAFMANLGMELQAAIVLGPNFALAFLTLWLVDRFGAAPRTCTEKIDTLMRAYDPVDVEAYLGLEQRGIRCTQSNGKLLHDWLVRERVAVGAALEHCLARAHTDAMIQRAHEASRVRLGNR